MSTPRILVVDDDKRIAASVRRSLTYDGYEVDVVHDGASAIDAVRSQPPDVIVLDLMLPGIDGLEVCRRLRAAGDDIAVLMLTAKSTVPDRVTGLDAGADDYLVKPFAHEELLARVRTLLRRKRSDDRAVVRYADLEMDLDAMEVRRGGREISLTALEFALLEYFLRNARIVLSRSRIREAVWDLDADTTSNVVDVYVRYLRQKIESDDAPPLLHTVRGAGYVLK
jgi:two-component system response regulator MprA